MEIILKTDVAHLGKMLDIVNVKNGYAAIICSLASLQC